MWRIQPRFGCCEMSGAEEGDAGTESSETSLIVAPPVLLSPQRLTSCRRYVPRDARSLVGLSLPSHPESAVLVNCICIISSIISSTWHKKEGPRPPPSMSEIRFSRKLVDLTVK